MLRVARVILALAHGIENGGIKSGSGRRANSTPSPPPSPPSRHPARSRPSIITPSPPSKLSHEYTNGGSSSPSPPTSTGNPLWFDTGSTQVWAGSVAQQAALRGTLVGKRRGGNAAASASTPNLVLAPPVSTSAATVNNAKARRESPTNSVIPVLTGRRGSSGPSAPGLTSTAMSPCSSSPAPATQVAASIATNKHVSLPHPSPTSHPPPARSSTSRPPPTGPHLLANRSSVASTATTTTTTSATDSLFDSPNTPSTGGAPRARWDKFGSIRTNVTGITVPSSGGVPSLSRSEARDVVKEMEERDVFGGEEKWTSAARMTNDSNDTIQNLSVPSTSGRRDRRSSELATDLVRVVEEDDETTPSQGARHLRRLVLPPGRNSPSHTPRSRVESDDVFTIDDDGPLTPPKSSSHEKGRAYSPSYFPRSPIKQDQLTGVNHHREASPSPVRIGGTSGLSSSPSRRQSGRLVPKGSSSANSSGYLTSKNRGSGELGFLGNESTSSLVEPPISSSLVPASSGSSPAVPIPFPRRRSNDMMKVGGKPALGRAYSVSNSPAKPSGGDPIAATARPTLPRSRILSDTTVSGGDASQRTYLDSALSDGPNDLKAGRRARFESMIDVTTSANVREGNLDEGAVRRTLVIKEPGQPAVHYVRCPKNIWLFQCLIETDAFSETRQLYRQRTVRISVSRTQHDYRPGSCRQADSTRRFTGVGSQTAYEGG